MAIELISKDLRLALLIGLALATLAVLAWVCWRMAAEISQDPKPVLIDFADLARTGRPNDYLVCPPGVCRSVPDEVSPILHAPVSRLREEWNTLIAEQPRTSLLSESSTGQLDVVQRSGFVGFPDIITVRFYSLGNDRSTLALYSRSQYGHWDLGVNRRRVQTWLRELKQRLAVEEATGRDEL